MMKSLAHAAVRLGLPVVPPICSVIFSMIFFCAGDAAWAQTASAPAARAPVVVELFTSEGCSSCPPADTLLQKLLAQQPVAGAEIIALEEHVDYWNHDGWEDPYSSAEWTQRQENYAALLKKDPYTPELVVDGRSQFVGNNEATAEREIEKAARSAKTEITVLANKPDGKNAQHFDVLVGKLEENPNGDVAEVWLAVTEDGLHSAVDRGENAGRRLQHVATLRSLHKIGVADAGATTASFKGDALVKLNPRWNVENLRVTVFVQKKKGREILGAASVKAKS